MNWKYYVAYIFIVVLVLAIGAWFINVIANSDLPTWLKIMLLR